MKANARRIFTWLKGLVKKVLITLVISLLISFIINRFVDMEYSRVLEMIGFAILGIASISVLGENKLNKDINYNLTRTMMDSDIQFKQKFDLKSYRFDFTIFMGLAGLIILLISRALY